MSLRTLVDGGAGELVAHRALKIGLHLCFQLLMVLTISALCIVVSDRGDYCGDRGGCCGDHGDRGCDNGLDDKVLLNLAPLVLRQTMKTLLRRLLAPAPNLIVL